MRYLFYLLFFSFLIFSLSTFTIQNATAFTTNQAATVVLGQSSFTTSDSGTTASELAVPQSNVFDSTGNLWVADSSNNRVVMYPKASLGTSGSAATVVLGWQDFSSPDGGTTDSTFHDPTSIAFDSTGNLWVADQGNHRVLMFLKASLGTSGIAATVVLGQSSFTTSDIGTTASMFHFPVSIAFDSTGNLWVSDQSNERVLMFPKANLGTSGSAATVVLGQSSFATSDFGTTASTFNAPQGLAFDSLGNLWVIDLVNNRVLMFPKANLGTSGSAATVVLGSSDFTTISIGPSATAFFEPEDLSFDQLGNLWVEDRLDNRVLMFPQANLGTSGSAATVVLGQPDFGSSSAGTSSTALKAPWGITFDSIGNLWVVDNFNNRVLKFNTSSPAPCLPPVSGDWTISSSCSLLSTATAPANVIVQSGKVLTIPNGLKLHIDLTHYHLLVKSGGGVLVKTGGAIK